MRRATEAGRWLFAAVVPASALAIGTLLTPVLAVMTIAAAISCTLLWLDPAARSSRACKWVVIAFAILVAFTIVQMMPLPASLVDAIAPSNGDAWDRALTPLREPGPSVHPISLAPLATHVELLRGLFYGCVFLAALRIALSEGGSVFLERVVIASALAIALSSLAHPAAHADRVFGIYRPRDPQGYVPGRIGPLLNPNHVAAYCNVGACVAAGAALARRPSMPRPLAAGTAVLLAGTSVWAGSRGGTGSLLVGALLIGGLTFYQKRRQISAGRSEAILALVALVAAGALIGIGASDVARTDLAGRDVGKLHMVATAAKLVPLSPVFGIGRGAFETTFPIVNTQPVYMTYLRAEDIVVQWLVEWGAPAAVLAGAALLFALRPSTVLTAARPPIGAWVAVVVAVLHDLVDFHLEVPGVVALVALPTAVVVGARAAKPEGPRRPATRIRLAAFATAAASIVIVAVVLPNADHSLRDDRERLAKMAVDRNVPEDTFRRDLREAILRYPAEPYFPLAGAIRAQVTREGSVVPWIGRALERYPTFGRAHLVLARSLAARHRAQARLEYRLAYESDLSLNGVIAEEAPRLVDDFDSALELVPNIAESTPLLESLVNAVAPRLPATAFQLDQELARRDPTAIGPVKRRVEGALSDLANQHPWCADSRRCADEAIEAARALVAREPERCDARVLLARVRIRAGDRTRAFDELRDAVQSTTDRAVCLRGLVELALANGEPRRAEQAIDLALRASCGTRGECIDLYVWAANMEAERHSYARASQLYKHAWELAPETDVYLERAAETSAQAGLVGEAISAYTKLADRHPEDATWRTRADALRANAEAARHRVPD